MSVYFRSLHLLCSEIMGVLPLRERMLEIHSCDGELTSTHHTHFHLPFAVAAGGSLLGDLLCFSVLLFSLMSVANSVFKRWTFARSLVLSV